MKGALHKICRTCKKEVLLEEFRYTDKRYISRRSSCKSCEADYKRTEKYKEQQSNTYKKKRRTDKEHREKVNKQCRLYGMTTRGRARRLLCAAKHRANINGLEFTIYHELIEFILIVGVCQKTGIPFDYSSPVGTNFNPYAPSIDRKNPFLGYTPTNIQVVCNAYNLAKHQWTDQQFLEFCRLVVAKNEQ